MNNKKKKRSPFRIAWVDPPLHTHYVDDLDVVLIGTTEANRKVLLALQAVQDIAKEGMSGCDAQYVAEQAIKGEPWG